MHISEGVVDINWCIAGYGAAIPLAGLALWKTAEEDIPKIAVMSAAFFAASLIHFPAGPSSAHLTLIGLTGIILGRQAPLAILTGLLFQAIMFHHGGLTVLGVNMVIMSCCALLTSILFSLTRRINRRSKVLSSIAGGVLSAVAVFMAALIVALLIWLSNDQYGEMAAVFVVANGVVAAIEGVAAFLIIAQLLRVKPDLIAGRI